MKQAEMEEPIAEGQGVAKIVREFDFPRETIFGMFTDPKKAAKWFGTPEGVDTVLFELDARPGGAIRIHARFPEGPIHKTSGTVLEVVAPERMSFKTVTGLEEGAIPWEALQTVTLEELSPRRTRVSVIVRVLTTGSFPGGTEHLLKGFQGGWGQTFDKLQRELQ